MLPTHQLQQYESIVQCDDLCCDNAYSISPYSSYLNATGSINDINVPVVLKSKSTLVQCNKKTEIRHIIAEYRKNCWKYLNNIDSLIDDAAHELNNNKNVLMQNEITIRKKISETKDEIQKLKYSFNNERVRISRKLKFVYIVLICIFLLILCSLDISKECYDWLFNRNTVRFNL